jgi:hypothetical protein
MVDVHVNQASDVLGTGHLARTAARSQAEPSRLTEDVARRLYALASAGIQHIGPQPGGHRGSRMQSRMKRQPT